MFWAKRHYAKKYKQSYIFSIRFIYAIHVIKVLSITSVPEDYCNKMSLF